LVVKFAATVTKGTDDPEDAADNIRPQILRCPLLHDTGLFTGHSQVSGCSRLHRGKSRCCSGQDVKNV
jgi:hypothetical protein